MSKQQQQRLSHSVYWKGGDSTLLEAELTNRYPRSFHHLSGPPNSAFFLNRHDAEYLVSNSPLVFGGQKYTFWPGTSAPNKYKHRLERGANVTQASLPVDVSYIFPNIPQTPFDLLIKNKGDQPVLLRSISFPAGPKNEWTLEGVANRSIPAGKTCILRVSFEPKLATPGVPSRLPLIFDFGDLGLKPFMLSYKPPESQQPKGPILDNFELDDVDTKIRRVVLAYPTVRGSKTHVHSQTETEYVEELGFYPVPKDIQIATNNRTGYKIGWDIDESAMDRIHRLLWIEEAQEVLNMRQYDLRDVQLEFLTEYEIQKLTYQEDFVRIPLPGLSEARPSILQNDQVYAYKRGASDGDPELADDGCEYEGWVLGVEKDAIVVAFNPVLKEKPNRGWSIRFSYSRYNKRVMHRAVDVFDREPRLLALIRPSKALALPEQRSDVPISAIQRANLNDQQVDFIHKCLNRVTGTAPLLLFGPFGTGKSYTLGKLVKNILLQHPKSRILICAPSNAATDALMDKLISESILPTQLFRLFAIRRKGFPERHKKYSGWNPVTEEFDVPPVDELKHKSVIVSTVDSTGTLFGIGMRGAFSHIIVDEAAQINLAHGLVPLSLASPTTALILAGDDKQLAPPVQSRRARALGFATSLISVFQTTHKLSMEQSVNLVSNYRSHPKILEWPSQTYYGDRLLPKASPNLTSKFQGWRHLEPGCPVLFVPVRGYDQRDADSPSWYNKTEAEKLVSLVVDLFNDYPETDPNEVGVVAATQKQVLQLRALLKLHRLGGVRVGSTEMFQGSERQALFISLVRSSRKLAEQDRDFSIGFSGDGRRLNTAFTRAMSLVVVVGDPFSMTADAELTKFMNWAKQNRAIKRDFAGPDLLSNDYLNERIASDLAATPQSDGAVFEMQGDPRSEAEQYVNENPLPSAAAPSPSPSPYPSQPPVLANGKTASQSKMKPPSREYKPTRQPVPTSAAVPAPAAVRAPTPNPTSAVAAPSQRQQQQPLALQQAPPHYGLPPGFTVFPYNAMPPQTQQTPAQQAQQAQQAQAHALAQAQAQAQVQALAYAQQQQLYQQQQQSTFAAGPNEFLLLPAHEWGYQPLLTSPVLVQWNPQLGVPSWEVDGNELVFSLVGLTCDYVTSKESLRLSFKCKSDKAMSMLHSPDGSPRYKAELVVLHKKSRSIEVFRSATALLLVLPPQTLPTSLLIEVNQMSVESLTVYDLIQVYPQIFHHLKFRDLASLFLVDKQLNQLLLTVRHLAHSQKDAWASKFEAVGFVIPPFDPKRLQKPDWSNYDAVWPIVQPDFSKTPFEPTAENWLPQISIFQYFVLLRQFRRCLEELRSRRIDLILRLMDSVRLDLSYPNVFRFLEALVLLRKMFPYELLCPRLALVLFNLAGMPLTRPEDPAWAALVLQYVRGCSLILPCDGPLDHTTRAFKQRFHDSRAINEMLRFRYHLASLGSELAARPALSCSHVRSLRQLVQCVLGLAVDSLSQLPPACWLQLADRFHRSDSMAVGEGEDEVEYRRSIDKQKQKEAGTEMMYEGPDQEEENEEREGTEDEIEGDGESDCLVPLATFLVPELADADSPQHLALFCRYLPHCELATLDSSLFSPPADPYTARLGALLDHADQSVRAAAAAACLRLGLGTKHRFGNSLANKPWAIPSLLGSLLGPAFEAALKRLVPKSAHAWLLTFLVSSLLATVLALFSSLRSATLTA